MFPNLSSAIIAQGSVTVSYDPKWDQRFLDLAAEVASWSKDPTTKVGAAIVRDDRTVASLGFNGLPRGVEDNDFRLGNREEKLAMTIHAELNAILSSHVPVRGLTLYATLPCCDRCAAHIIQSGIRRVVTLSPDVAQAARWGESFERAVEMFREAGVEVAQW